MTNRTDQIILRDPINTPDRWMITRIGDKVFLELGVETTELTADEAFALSSQLLMVSQ